MELIIIASLLTFISAFGGGYLLLTGRKFKEDTLKVFAGFSAGLLITIAIAHILPEVNLGKNYLFVLLGVGLFYSIQSCMHIRSCSEEGCHEHEATGPIAFLGISLHSLVDGIALGTSLSVSQSLGILVMAAIFIHKAPIGLSLVTILASKGYKRPALKRDLFLFSCVTPISALIIYYLLHGVGESITQAALAFSGGTLLHIWSEDLLPEVHQARNYMVVFSVSLGMLVGLLPKFIGI